MPAVSKSQQRLFGMIHAYKKGKLHAGKILEKKLERLSDSMSDESVLHYAKTEHKDLPEKKADLDIPSIYDYVRKGYVDLGYPVTGDKLVISRQPTYNDGRLVPEYVVSPNESGGNTQDDGTVRINPEYRKVMRHWNINGKGRDFLESIIGHELGHHIDRTVFKYSYNDARRKKLLKEIAEGKFHTIYTDSYDKAKTDRSKLDKELLAEYLSSMVKKKLEERRAKK